MVRREFSYTNRDSIFLRLKTSLELSECDPCTWQCLFGTAYHMLYKIRLEPSVSLKILAFIVQTPRTKPKKNNENKQVLNTTTFHTEMSILQPSSYYYNDYGRGHERQDDKMSHMALYVLVLAQEKVVCIAGL